VVYVNDDTICAIASAPGVAARGIIRLSGPESLSSLAAICMPFELPSQSLVLPIEIEVEGSRSIRADAYIWPSTRSYTKQPSVEIHMNGSRPLLDDVLSRLCERGARIAQPGEFTMRAFLAGRIDLPQAEAVLGVIDADNDKQLKSALSQLAGGLSSTLKVLRDELIHLLAHLEAGLDFVEEDIEFISSDELQNRLGGISRQLTETLQQMQSRTTQTEAYQIVLTGLPNAGKSSLMNAITGDEIAIVSEQAGTTRDYIKMKVDIGGFPCELVDTAGIETVLGDGLESTVKNSAQSHTAKQTSGAHLILSCIDLSSTDSGLVARDIPQTPSILVGTKSDLGTDRNEEIAEFDVKTSSVSCEGIESLVELIAKRLEEHSHQGEFLFSTSSRCRDCLAQAVESIEQAISVAQNNLGEELVAADLRLALDQLGQIIGVVYTDDILDQIFGQFCIGK